MGGDRFGRTKVSRPLGYDLLVAAGLAVIVGGTILSGYGASVCESNAHHSWDNPIGFKFECFAGGFLGILGTMVGGLTILGIGLHGELKVTQQAALRFAPNGLVLCF